MPAPDRTTPAQDAAAPPIPFPRSAHLRAGSIGALLVAASLSMGGCAAGGGAAVAERANETAPAATTADGPPASPATVSGAGQAAVWSARPMRRL